jgi:uncharacterized repeat protein (TIGR03847 family)
MPPTVLEINPVDRITAGAVGEPGQRVFYLQARQGSQLTTLICEKAQLQSLAVAVEQFLGELQERYPDLPEASAVFDESRMELEQPLDPLFRAGQIGLGYNDETDQLVLETRELLADSPEGEEGSVVRCWCTRSQLRGLARWGLELAQRGRPICGNCGEPIDPGGHFCPKRNGHKH